MLKTCRFATKFWLTTKKYILKLYYFFYFECVCMCVCIREEVLDPTRIILIVVMLFFYLLDFHECVSTISQELAFVSYIWLL